MKKIKTIKQLQDEKKVLGQRRVELEKLMRVDWLELKKSVSPAQLFSKKSTAKKEVNGKSIIGYALSQLAGQLTGRLVEKAGSQMQKWFKR